MEDGRTVLVSSHQLHQVQQICDRVGIFVEGKLVASGRIEFLGKQVLIGGIMAIEFAAYPDNEELLELIKSIQGVKEVKKEKGMFLILEELVRIFLFLFFTVVYMSLWLSVSLLFSLVFRHAATSALSVIALWLFFAIFMGLLAGLIANGLFPVNIDSPVNAVLNNRRWEQNIAEFLQQHCIMKQ